MHGMSSRVASGVSKEDSGRPTRVTTRHTRQTVFPVPLMCSRASPGDIELRIQPLCHGHARRIHAAAQPQFNRCKRNRSQPRSHSRAQSCTVAHCRALSRTVAHCRALSCPAVRCHGPFMVHHASCPALNPEEPTHHALRANSARRVSQRLDGQTEHRKTEDSATPHSLLAGKWMSFFLCFSVFAEASLWVRRRRMARVFL
jgi:hypothetical protein